MVSRQSRNVPLAGKVEMSPFDVCPKNRCYAAAAGEAETGAAGEQPDRGIAGRNSSADDEMERDPPDAFCYLGSGPAIGRRHGSAPGFGLDFGSHIGPDRFRHASKTHTRQLGMTRCGRGPRSGATGSSQILQSVKEFPGLPAGRAERFPV